MHFWWVKRAVQNFACVLHIFRIMKNVAAPTLKKHRNWPWLHHLVLPRTRRRPCRCVDETQRKDPHSLPPDQPTGNQRKQAYNNTSSYSSMAWYMVTFPQLQSFPTTLFTMSTFKWQNFINRCLFCKVKSNKGESFVLCWYLFFVIAYKVQESS